MNPPPPNWPLCGWRRASCVGAAADERYLRAAQRCSEIQAREEIPSSAEALAGAGSRRPGPLLLLRGDRARGSAGAAGHPPATPGYNPRARAAPRRPPSWLSPLLRLCWRGWTTQPADADQLREPFRSRTHFLLNPILFASTTVGIRGLSGYSFKVDATLN